MARKKKSVVISFERSLSSHLRVVSIFVIVALLLSIPFFLSVLKSQQKAISPYNKKQLTIPPHARYVPHELLIKYHSGMSPEELKSQIAHESSVVKFISSLSGAKTPDEELNEIQQTLRQAGVLSETQLDGGSMPGYYLLSLQQNQNIAQSQKILNNADFIDYAEPNYLMVAQKTPNDPYYKYQWSLQTIHAPQAWDITTGSSNVKVGVLDSGVDTIHQDLIGNVIADHDYVYNQNASVDVEGHGTFVAGIIGAVGNNNTGITGISWNVSMYDEKICDNEKEAQCSDVSAHQALMDAANNGFKVVNLSVATPAPAETPCSQDYYWQDAINYAVSHGTIVVVAAGNDNRDISVVSPASCPNVIVVGATGPQNERAMYSNYGAVTIAAPGGDPVTSQTDPGQNISSTGNNGGYEVGAGTSFASPQVTGVLALLYSQYPNLSADQIKHCLLTGSDPITTDKPIGGRIVDAYGALKACQNVTPPTPTIRSTATPLQTPTPTTAPLPTITSAPPPPGTSISGVVFFDDNGNGKQDSGELGYSGAQITLSGVGAAQTTDATGNFSFNNLQPGKQYLLQVIINGHLVYTWQNTLTQNIFLSFPLAKDFLDSGSHGTPIVVTQTPIPQQNPTQSPQNTGGNQNPQNNQQASIPSPIPSPVPLYDCVPYTSQKMEDGKEITITQLQCSPL